MIEPAPYSTTDAAEQNAVITFESLVDSRFVKAEIRTRDKYPNVDGIVEIVDDRQVPLGKFDVQVRSIKSKAKTYSCPTSLVGYSQRSTLPVILICADSSTPRVFWRHITSTMPEFKEGQKSFTIHFSESSDTIDKDGIYLTRWLEIVRDYQIRIADYPILRAEVTNKQISDDIDPRDLELFQRFIGSVNRLLETEFIAVKQVLYPYVWNLGVGIFDLDQEKFSFQIYRIPYGQSSPLVCKIDQGTFLSDQPNPYAIAEFDSWSKESLIPPENAAKQFVLERVELMVEKRAFPIHGQMLAEDVLFSFVDQYHCCLNLKANQDSYSTKDLDYALYHHLFGICRAIVSKSAEGTSTYKHIDLDWLSRYLAEENVRPVSSNKSQAQFSIGSRQFSMRAVFESLRYLLANKIEVINRPFVRRSSLPPGGHWIWAGYSQEDEIKSVVPILSNCIQEYKAFVMGNHLRLPNSPYLDTETAIIFVYEPVGTNGHRSSSLEELHIPKSQGNLPKLSVFVKAEDDKSVVLNERLLVTVNNAQYKATSAMRYDATFFFGRTPVSALIYKMLARDLSKHYDIRLSTRYIP